MSTPAQLCERLSVDRLGAERLADQFARWWDGRHPEGQELLDELAARAGSDEVALSALLSLIDRHGLARAALRRTLVDNDDVDEAEQSTMAVVAFKIDSFDGRARFTTWLYQVARNEAKMLIRSRSRRPATPVAEPELTPFLARLSTLLANRDVIDRAFEALPEEYRRPLRLREFDGLEYDEIAATLGIPIGTVRSRLSRGRARLVEQLRSSPT